MRSFFIVLIVCVWLLASCSEEGRRTSVEDLAMVSSIAFDYENEEEMKMTVTIPHPTGENEEITQVYSVTADLIQEGLVEVSSQADKMIILNQLRTLLFSEEFARQGKVAEVIEHFYRNATVGNNVRLGIVKGRAGDVLKSVFPDKPNTDIYLNDLLQPKLHTSFSPFTTLHVFQYSESSPVFFSMVPYLIKKQDAVEIDGVALFDHGKMRERVSRKEGLYIQALRGLDKLSPLTITFDNGAQKHKVHIQLIENKVDMKSNRNMQSPKLAIKLKLQGSLYEYKGDKDLSNPAAYHALEKEVSRQAKKEIEQLLAKLRELEVDPIGFSDYFRMYHKGKWEEALTKEMLEKAASDVKVDFKLLNTGTIE